MVIDSLKILKPTGDEDSPSLARSWPGDDLEGGEQEGQGLAAARLRHRHQVPPCHADGPGLRLAKEATSETSPRAWEVGGEAPEERREHTNTPGLKKNADLF